jgi:hypothetical protein
MVFQMVYDLMDFSSILAQLGISIYSKKQDSLVWVFTILCGNATQMEATFPAIIKKELSQQKMLKSPTHYCSLVSKFVMKADQTTY